MRVVCVVMIFFNSFGAFNPRLSKKEIFEDIAIKNRFRYEDSNFKADFDETSTNKIKEVLDDIEEINDSLDSIVESEKDKRRHQIEKIHQVDSWNEVYRVLMVSLMGLTIVLVMTVLCNLCSRLFSTHSTPDSEKIVLVQDRFQQVYHGQI